MRLFRDTSLEIGLYFADTGSISLSHLPIALLVFSRGWFPQLS